MTTKKELTVEELLADIAVKLDKLERKVDENTELTKKAAAPTAAHLPKPKVPTMPFGAPQTKAGY